ncbi:MAG: class I adenylate-forming enzyme family protein [Phenylobacterium sp.]|uniref:class I adenylate-forming enzyme family protein n=1 Tax=Phenylobacterium sp. TaxID=1871053 RepID=UPI002732314D|nr:class I adenylate-forming enzyme family protein [Phenylobacterium sp.]MDP3746672.1 class I adenylate-forming enzyme family protein [Phenylobacterium sp.]
MAAAAQVRVAGTEPARPVDIDVRLRAAAKRHPGRSALQDSQRSLTWAEFDARINRIANALIRAGVEPNDRVAILARNSVAYAELIFGALRAGACVTPLSGLASPEALVSMVQDSGAKHLFLGEDYAADMIAREREMPGLAPGGLMTLGFELDARRSFEAFIADAPEASPAVEISPDHGFNLIYSSGTTGTPKGILQDRRFRAQEAQDMIAGFGLDETMRTLVSTPLYSNTTLFLFVATMAAGGSAVIMEKFHPAGFLALSQVERITHAVVVPVQFTRLLKEPDFDRFDLSSYRAKFCTSAPLHASVKREILDRWPAGGLTEFYGMTEGGVNCVLAAHEHPDKLDTVGLPAPDCDLRIVDEEARELPRGEVGEIVGRGSKMMVGYHNREEATAEASWYDEQGRRFHRSGDVGWLDADGFLHLLDRKKDMIISGGFNIYAIDLERVLLAHPDVADAAVIGAPSADWGETPVAFVVLRAGTAPDLEALRSWANARLGKAQRIAELRVLPELPRSPIGKVLKRELRELLPPAAPG